MVTTILTSDKLYWTLRSISDVMPLAWKTKSFSLAFERWKDTLAIKRKIGWHGTNFDANTFLQAGKTSYATVEAMALEPRITWVWHHGASIETLLKKTHAADDLFALQDVTILHDTIVLETLEEDAVFLYRS